MSEEKSKSLDVLGVKPFADAINTATKGVVDGAGAFLGRICLPAAEEFGLFLKDQVSTWRGNNALNIVVKAEHKFNELDNRDWHAHPRIVYDIIEKGSWVNDRKVQDMWAGLMASACSEDGQDESNLIFINTLSQITSIQAEIVNYACESADKAATTAGWIESPGQFTITLEDLTKLTNVSDLHRLDRELDHLRAMELIRTGFEPYSTTADITPSSLALQLYVRCQGYTGSPLEYFGIQDGTSP